MITDSSESDGVSNSSTILDVLHYGWHGTTVDLLTNRLRIKWQFSSSNSNENSCWQNYIDWTNKIIKSVNQPTNLSINSENWNVWSNFVNGSILHFECLTNRKVSTEQKSNRQTIKTDICVVLCDAVCFSSSFSSSFSYYYIHPMGQSRRRRRQPSLF